RAWASTAKNRRGLVVSLWLLLVGAVAIKCCGKGEHKPKRTISAAGRERIAVLRGQGGRRQSGQRPLKFWHINGVPPVFHAAAELNADYIPSFLLIFDLPSAGVWAGNQTCTHRYTVPSRSVIVAFRK